MHDFYSAGHWTGWFMTLLEYACWICRASSIIDTAIRSADNCISSNNAAPFSWLSYMVAQKGPWMSQRKRRKRRVITGQGGEEHGSMQQVEFAGHSPLSTLQSGVQTITSVLQQCCIVLLIHMVVQQDLRHNRELKVWRSRRRFPNDFAINDFTSYDTELQHNCQWEYTELGFTCILTAWLMIDTFDG